MATNKKHPSKQKAGSHRWAMRLLMGLAVVVIAGGLLFLRSGPDAQRGPQQASKDAVVRKETSPTLSPARFVGKAARAHQIAQEIPDILDQLHCYCDCEKHMNHKSLLSCYTDGHAGTCDICIEEALEGSRLYQQGKDGQEITAQIDRQFGRL